MPYKDKQVAREYRKAYYSRRRKEDTEYARIMQTSWRDRNPKRYIWTRAKGRAAADNIPFTITEADFDIPEYCPIFPNLKLAFSSGRATRPDNIPTLDRLVPALGYVPGNVAVISMRANRLKSDASKQDLEAIVAWMTKRENEVKTFKKAEGSPCNGICALTNGLGGTYCRGCFRTAEEIAGWRTYDYEAKEAIKRLLVMRHQIYNKHYPPS